MPNSLPRAPSQYHITHGLYLDLEKVKIDGRSALGQALSRSKAALAEMFPEGCDAAANILIDRIVYKSLRVQLFENWDYNSAKATPTAIRNYTELSNSLRKDVLALVNLAKRQSPASSDPDLCEYLETIKKAAKAQVHKVESE